MVVTDDDAWPAHVRDVVNDPARFQRRTWSNLRAEHLGVVAPMKLMTPTLAMTAPTRPGTPDRAKLAMMARPEMSLPEHAREVIPPEFLALERDRIAIPWPYGGGGTTVDAGGSNRAHMNGSPWTPCSRRMLSISGILSQTLATLT